MYSKLDLVNACLRAIGNDRVSDLEYPDVDTDMSITAVEEALVDTLSSGWWFNTESWNNLNPDNLGMIEVPATMLSFKMEDNCFVQADLVVRSRKLYDKTHQTFDLRPIIPSGGLRLRVIIALEIEDIPVACQQYIRTRARVKVMQDMDTDANKVEMEKSEELRYLAILERTHRKAMKTNVYNTPKVRNVMGSLQSPNNYFGGYNPMGKDEC